MTPKSVLDGMELKLGKVKKPVPFSFQGPAQCQLLSYSTMETPGDGVSILMAGVSHIVERKPDPDTVGIRTALHSPEEHADLVIEVLAIARKYVLVVKKGDIALIDYEIHELLNARNAVLDLSTKCYLLDKQLNFTHHHYTTSMCWPLSSLKFGWSDIPTPPKEEPDSAE